jgi:hypothetical protein
MRSLPLVLLAAVAVSCSNAPPAGMCTSGQTACGSECADLKTNAAHCGMCGTACTSGQSCVAGQCFAETCAGTTCAAAQICSNDHCMERACVDVTCPAGQGCLGGSCVPTSCGGMQCPSGQLCVNGACADASCFGVICPSGQSCVMGACAAGHCTDGMKDADETDVDCGGSCPTKCKPAQGCTTGTDCASGSCVGSMCAQAAGCSDGKRDGSETDIDCGGADCSLRCSVGQGCLQDTDCTSGTCSSGVCAGPSCSDGKKNGTETDVDCGGACSLKCAQGQHCSLPADCTTGSCVGGVCTMASCTDGQKNGDESDVDCGGSCPLKCAVNDHCGVPADCTTMSCQSGLCAAATCFDHAKNGTETDVDCGGTCAAKCPNGEHCALPADCTSVSCVGGTCAGSSCTDMMKNGTETDVDCGGACSACSDGLHCLVRQDCQSMSCSGGVCQTPSCTDGVQNGQETDVDCGHVCPNGCAAGLHCAMGSDCASGSCNGTTCVGATCFDGMKNGGETDIDCGGPCTRKCNPGQGCAMPSDCTSNVCAAMVCGADPLNSGLLGYWTMNAADINGNTIIDASGNGHYANMVGSFASAAGNIGESVQFIGGASYLNVGQEISPTATISMSAWLKSSPTGALQTLVNKWCNNSGCAYAEEAFYMGVDANGHAICEVNSISNVNYTLTGTASVVDNAWHLITCTIDKNSPGNNFNLYVDGALAAQSVIGGNIIAFSTDTLKIGKGVYGNVDDVRIYGRVLSSNEVLSLKTTTYPGVPTSPTGLSATAASTFEIDLSWTPSPSPGVTGYVIERSLTGTGSWFPIAVAPGTAAVFADATLPAGTKLYYRVSAQTPSGTSMPTAVANATTQNGVTKYSVPGGLTGYWTCNAADISSNVEIDGSGNSNSAVLFGSPPTTAGKIGEGLSSTVSTYLSVSNSISPSAAMTLASWINTTQTSTGYTINRFCNSSGCAYAEEAYRLGVNLTALSGLAGCQINTVGNVNFTVNSQSTVNDGRWHLIVCVADANGTGNNMRMYVDGVLDNDVFLGTNQIATSTDVLKLGYQYVGTMDDLRIYTRALTATEIHTLYNNGSMGSP